jgi:hypothetical protein
MNKAQIIKNLYNLDKMVDSDFFTEFNKFLIIEQNRILLEYKNCDYTLEL